MVYLRGKAMKAVFVTYVSDCISVPCGASIVFGLRD